MRTLLILSILLLTNETYAQRIVRDRRMNDRVFRNTMTYSPLLQRYIEQQKIAEDKVAKFGTSVTAIYAIENKLYSSLTDVSSFLRDGLRVKRCALIVGNIIQYYSEMLKYAQNHPELTVVTTKAQMDIAKKVLGLSFFIQNVALKGGEENLMNTVERAELVQHIENELKGLRGLTYLLCTQMKWADKRGTVNVLNPFGDYYLKDKGVFDNINRDTRNILSK